jgi:integrase
MPVQWKKTKYQGVRYYEHPTRKHGVNLDRYFAIRYQVDGKRREEGLGWTSEKWTAEKAAFELAALKKAHTLGEGPASLEEKRALEKERRGKALQEKTRLEKENLTLGKFFNETYKPLSKTSKKKGTHRKGQEHFKNWIEPVLGNVPLSTITPFHLEKLKKKMLDAGKAPRTVQYVFATVRQIWNMARRNGVVFQDSPTKQVKIGKFDNRRVRFLTHEEAEKILNDLQIRNRTVYNMALVSLHCGLRFGEIANLKWNDIDLDRGFITILDPKGGVNRTAFMTGAVKKMLETIERIKNDALIFLNTKGEKFTDSPQTFRDSVKALKLNEAVTDRRQHVVFHSLRHTFASWLVEAGTDLYIVKELMGHEEIKMTARYSHLGQNTLQSAVKNLEQSMTMAKKEQEAKTMQEGKA